MFDVGNVLFVIRSLFFVSRLNIICLYSIVNSKQKQQVCGKFINLFGIFWNSNCELCKRKRKVSFTKICLINSFEQATKENSLAIEIQFKNNRIRNEILNNDRAHIGHMLEFIPISQVVLNFSGNFFREINISSLNYAVGAKKSQELHKLSRKSSELIPPAQHPMCSALLNKFIFSLRRSASKGKKKL